jgi:hypothetical protein
MGQYLSRRQIFLDARKPRRRSSMRYRIQIEQLLDCVVVAVTTINAFGGSVHHQTKLYTIESRDVHIERISEVMSHLAMLMSESD